MDKEYMLSTYHIELMKHCIGLGLGQKVPYRRNGRLFYKPYRNYFSVTSGSNDDQNWMYIKAIGLAVDKFSNSDKDGATWHLNSDGMKVIGKIIGAHIYTDRSEPFDFGGDDNE